MGRGGDDLPAAAVRAARPGRRHARRPLRPADACSWSATCCAARSCSPSPPSVAAESPVAARASASPRSPRRRERQSGRRRWRCSLGSSASRGSAPANALLHTVQDLGVVVGPAIGAVLLAVARRLRWRSSSTRPRSRSRRRSSRRCAAAPPRRHAARARAPAPSSRTGCTPRAPRRSSCRCFVVVAMAELTYGAQTVQLVLYAEQRLDARRRRLRLPARRRRGRRPAERARQRAARGEHAGLGHRRRHRRAVLRHAARLRGGRRARRRAAGDAARRRRLRRLRGGRRDDARPRRAGRRPGSRRWASFEARVGRRRWWLGAVLAPVLIAWTSLRDEPRRPRRWPRWSSPSRACVGLRGLDALSRERAEALASRVAVIERLPIAAGAPRLVLEQLASASQLCPLPAGRRRRRRGRAGARLLRRDRRAASSSTATAPRSRTSAPGDRFGERGLLDNAPRNATVTTEEPSTLLRLEGDVLLEALQAAPTMRSALDRSNVRGRRRLRPRTRPLSTTPRGHQPRRRRTLRARQSMEGAIKLSTTTSPSLRTTSRPRCSSSPSTRTASS